MAKFESYRQGTPSYVELMAPDPEKAAQFYGELFGWEITEDPLPEEIGGGVYRSGKLQGDMVAGISGQMPGLEGHPAFWGVYLAVDDVDDAVVKVKEAGGTVEAEPFDVMDMGRMASIQDPTGARVNLWQANTSVGTERAHEPGTPIWNEVVSPDPAAAAAFYEQALGMGQQERETPSGTYISLTDVDGKVIGGAMRPMMEGIPPHWNVYFNVESVDAMAERVQQLGGQVVAPAFDVPGVGRLGFFADPQGAMFAVMQNPPGQDAQS